MNHNWMKKVRTAGCMALCLCLIGCGKADDGDSGRVSDGDSNISGEVTGGDSEDWGSLPPEEPETVDPVFAMTMEDVLNGYEATGSCGENLTWYYKSNVLVIQGTGDMTDYIHVDLDFKDPLTRPGDWSKVRRVIIDEGCTRIGERAFWRCTRLQAVEIPSSVTEINTEAFSCCSALTDIRIPDTVTELRDGAFYGCGLTELPVMNGVKYIPYQCFESCKIRTLVIPDHIQIIGECAFEDNPLESVSVPDSVREIGRWAFQDMFYADSLREVSLPGNLNWLEDILGFRDREYPNLESLTVPDGVKTIPRTIAESTVKIIWRGTEYPNGQAFADAFYLASRIPVPEEELYQRSPYTGAYGEEKDSFGDLTVRACGETERTFLLGSATVGQAIDREGWYYRNDFMEKGQFLDEFDKVEVCDRVIEDYGVSAEAEATIYTLYVDGSGGLPETDDCPIDGLMQAAFQNHSDAVLYFPGNITIHSSLEEVFQAWGRPADAMTLAYESQDETYYFWQKNGYGAEVRVVIKEEGEEILSIVFGKVINLMYQMNRDTALFADTQEFSNGW